jgi:DNA-binding MarR family transcriptional regulator
MSQGGIDLDSSLGYLLKQASSTLHASMDAVLRPLGMSITHYSCLELLAQRPGMSGSELARGASVSRQAMNVLLQKLERDGLVRRSTLAPIRRMLPVELTPRGRRQLRTASAAVKAVEDDMRAGMNAGDQDQLRHLLTACITSLAAPSASRRDGVAPARVNRR